MDKRQTITACAFVHKEGKLLIGKRSSTKTFLPNKWELPGGHIEFGETVEKGLVRELKEEFNIDVALDSLYHEFTYIIEETKEHVIEVLYFAHMINPDQTITVNTDELSDYKWITKDEISSYFKDDDDEGTAVKRGFELLK